MKAALFILLPALLPFACFARQQQTRQKTVTVETTHEHHGASHTQTRTTIVPTEHHSTVRWHYHSGAKRPQVPVQGSDKMNAAEKSPDNTQGNEKVNEKK